MVSHSMEDGVCLCSLVTSVYSVMLIYVFSLSCSHMFQTECLELMETGIFLVQGDYLPIKSFQVSIVDQVVKGY